MSRSIDTERILDAFLAPESDQLADRVLDAALADIARTPQRRAWRVPWRFRHMPALARLTALAAAVLVLAVGAGGLVYLNSPGGAGGAPAPVPTTTSTQAPAPTPTPAASVAPGITGWKTYTSEQYGHTISYPSDWRVEETATSQGQADVFLNPEDVDGEAIALFVQQVQAPTGADLGSREGLQAALRELCDPDFTGAGLACPTDDPPIPMCLGDQECKPAIITLVSDERTPDGLFGDPETGIITLFAMGREDDFPAAARYGGTVTLLKSILAQVGVREPRPGETPQ